MKLTPEKDERSIYMQKKLQKATRYRGNFTYTTPITVLTSSWYCRWVMHPICKANEWKGRMNSIMKILSLEDSDINQTSLYSRSYVCGEIVSARSYWEKKNVRRWNERVRGKKLWCGGLVSILTAAVENSFVASRSRILWLSWMSTLSLN